MDVATPLHMLRGKAMEAEAQLALVHEAAQEIPPPGYRFSTKEHAYRWNGTRELPFLALKVRGRKEESFLQRQEFSDSCSNADARSQVKETSLWVSSSCISPQEVKVMSEPSSSIGQPLRDRFEAKDIHCPSKETRKDYVLHHPGLVESPSPPYTGVEDDDIEGSQWESLSVEQAMQQMTDMHCAENYVEKCVYLLQKCKSRGSLAFAARMYDYICDNGLEAHGILGSYIVAMFVHCGSVPMAQQAYNRLFHHNEYSWTHLLQGYIEGGDPEHGLYLFSRMKKAGIRPSKFTFVAVLRACTTLKCINRGQQLHAEIVKVLEEDPYVTRALVDFYVKCGLFAEACDIFYVLCNTANFLEKTCITGLADNALYKKSVDSLDNMQVKEVLTSAVHVFFLKACSSMKAITMGRELHLQVVKEGHDLDHFVSNTLVDMYAKCGSISEAWKVLNKMSARDVVSWTALITGCVEHGLSEDALKYSEMMQKEGVPANAFTLVSCLKACGHMQALDSGRKLHAEIMREGLYTDFVICNSLVDMYAKCGSLDEARMVFDHLARQDIVSWTSLIAGYTDNGSFKEAINCFEQMQTAGVSPNIVTFICCLKACASLADLEVGRRLHNDLIEEELETNIFVGNGLLRMYARCSSYLEARAIFDDLPTRDDVSWTILIAELTENGHSEQALTILEQMEREGSCPSSFTFVHSLKACASLGAIARGRKLHIEIMKRGFERVPSVSKALIGMYAECGKPINFGMA